MIPYRLLSLKHTNTIVAAALSQSWKQGSRGYDCARVCLCVNSGGFVVKCGAENG